MRRFVRRSSRVAARKRALDGAPDDAPPPEEQEEVSIPCEEHPAAVAGDGTRGDDAPRSRKRRVTYWASAARDEPRDGPLPPTCARSTPAGAKSVLCCRHSCPGLSQRALRAVLECLNEPSDFAGLALAFPYVFSAVKALPAVHSLLIVGSRIFQGRACAETLIDLRAGC